MLLILSGRIQIELPYLAMKKAVHVYLILSENKNVMTYEIFTYFIEILWVMHKTLSEEHQEQVKVMIAKT